MLYLKLPMRSLITKSGLDTLITQREKLIGERPDAVLDLKKAREMGDLSENGYYKSARAKLSGIDRQIRYLTRQIKTAQVIEAKQYVFVEVGHTVTLLQGNDEVSYIIVGTLEADPSEKKISHKSPLGSKLLGKKVGEKIELVIPSGTVSYQVLRIS